MKESTILKDIKNYCNLNLIDDVDGFINKCLTYGFNIIRYGVSPKDNVRREINGIKDFQEESSNKKEISQEKSSKSRIKIIKK